MHEGGTAISQRSRPSLRPLPLPPTPLRFTRQKIDHALARNCAAKEAARQVELERQAEARCAAELDRVSQAQREAKRKLQHEVEVLRQRKEREKAAAAAKAG